MKKHPSLVCYVTPEIAILPELASYTGGLGYLAGSYARSAPKSGLHSIIIAPLGRYYEQTIIDTPEGKRMGVEDPPLHPEEHLVLTDIEHTLPLGHGMISIRVWKFDGEKHGSADVYFLDTDYNKNPEEFRAVTRFLYGGFSRNGVTDDRRVMLTFVLGVGAVMTAERLGLKISAYHLNECHAVFAAMELLREALVKHPDLDQALPHVRRRILFTTHTPVPAGIWRFEIGKVFYWTQPHLKFSREIYERLGKQDFDFSLGIAALRLAGESNAVSKRHLTTMERMWAWVTLPPEIPPMTFVTNGVDREFWQHPVYREVTNPAELRRAKILSKRSMIDYIRERTGRRLSEHVLTVVFARRWTSYKRPLLLLDKLETVGIEKWLRHNQIQLVYAGRPNPDEMEMVDGWNKVLRLSELLPNLVILPNYDLNLSFLLKRGADLWVNTPAAPKEASGTSGMSANMNGAINQSIADGWMLEADPSNAFLFGLRSEREWWRQWSEDASQLRTTLAAVIAKYYDEPDAWDEMAFSALREAEERWNASRMVKEYQELYRKLEQI